ncbi:isocitrate/isopropylmalate dehydrogenase family protein [Mycetocola saprophilus]|uniref:isocitrate/isopropylmalate dehydrogenase family protein n=1 Tax=Mycetocola saprophilus TaxID=76636 RepID=UPI003BF21F6B
MAGRKMRIAVLPGDGIGAEVVEAALPIIEAVGLPWTLEIGDIGWEFWKHEGTPVPPRTWDLITRSAATLVGAVTSKPPREARAELDVGLRSGGRIYVSPVIQLRQRLALFANLRPVADLRGDRFGFVVIRENTEGLYSGIDYREVPEALWPSVGTHPNAARSGREHTAMSIRLQTEFGLRRIIEFGFSFAARHGFHRVTLADKPNVLRNSSELVREIFDDVGRKYPQIEGEILNVDAVGLWIVTRPERFGVIVAENMFGDILSDVGAGVMGGLGLATSGNIGSVGTYFEPVHGSAPALVGAQRANPLAMILTIAQMAAHHGFTTQAQVINAAVRRVIVLNRADELTPDLGGHATTSAAAHAVIGAVK